MSEYQEQLASARRGGPPAELPRCVECTPQSIKELFCTGCLVWKDLNSFSGQQRKKPDDAVRETGPSSFSNDIDAVLEMLALPPRDP